MSRNNGIMLDQALERTGDGAFVIDADGRVIMWNRAAERILGFTARDVIGRPCCDVLGGRDDEDNRLCYPGCQAMTLAAMGESVQSFDLRTRTKAGQAIWLNVSILAVGNGRPAGRVMVHLVRDVTATKELLRLIHERLAPPPNGGESNGALTRRELEVLRLVAAGVRTRAAAERLHVSSATVKNHVQNILAKLGVHSRLEAVAYAHRHRLF